MPEQSLPVSPEIMRIMNTKSILQNAVKAKTDLKKLSSQQKNSALLLMAQALCENTEKILKANEIDLKNPSSDISDVMIDRLRLSNQRISDMAEGIRQVASLADPNGAVLKEIRRENGLIIKKVLVPMGVIGIIYESRPNVTSDAAALCFKSSNVCVLRGGRQAYNTSKAITDILRAVLRRCDINPDCINIIDDTSRQSALELMKAKGFIDLLIPRGGKGLITACVENATVPCIETGTGICHIYVERNASFDKALDIIENAKKSRPSVCNACEVCLVDEEIAGSFLPLLKQRLEEGNNPVKLILSQSAQKYIDGQKADDQSFDTEFLDYILAVNVVPSINEAVEHIAKHSTGHSEAIITESKLAASYFFENVDSAAVYVNASTRFTDGGEFGLGCEMGISTQKLHARGPMGLEEIMTTQFRIIGNGNIR